MCQCIRTNETIDKRIYFHIYIHNETLKKIKKCTNKKRSKELKKLKINILIQIIFCSKCFNIQYFQ